MSGRAWWACEHPERPPDPWVLWHPSGCRGCALAAAVQVRMFPDDAVAARILGPIADSLGEAS